ncbi:MAG: PEP-CTERM sorting domain-containing protein [Terrimicrobiaceae bacterium]|nr:PEP-CTERM sorting domain-containing protein [Terrimicrobiaceae bacterium]
MKNYILAPILGVILPLIFSGTSSAQVLLDFDTSSDLSSNFGAPSGFTYDGANPGVGAVNGRVNMGALSATKSTTLIYNLAVGDTLETYIYFRLNSTTGAVVTIGYTEGTSTLTSGANSIGARLNGSGELEGRENGSVYDPNVAAVLNTTDVFRLNLSLTKTTTANQFSYTSSIQNFGTNGLSGSPTLVASIGPRTVTNATMYSSTALTFNMRNGGTGSPVTWIDNIGISQVPEPSTPLMLLGGAGLAALTLRRRR